MRNLFKNKSVIEIWYSEDVTLYIVILYISLGNDIINLVLDVYKIPENSIRM